MALIDEINANNEGSKFLRADLHIHSYGEGGSYDVADVTMLPSAIVDLAIQEGIQVISITDHNEILNSKVAIDYAVGKPILVIPGVELSTTHGHLLVYLPSFELLRIFYGKLNVSADKKMCDNTIVQCLNFAGELGGFGVAAHIDIDAGFESYMAGYTPFKEAVLCNVNLLGLEIKTAINEDWYTTRDANADRKRLTNLRKTTLGEDSTYNLPKLMSSDAHALTALGRNAVGNKKITRIKMDELNFNSFKVALLDPIARIRIEDLIPANIPHFVGVKFDGGFLDGEVIKFNKNLTCIIGGRGAGKSTVFESVIVASGHEAKEDFVDNEIWPERISLIYEDEVGMQQVFIKDKMRAVVNATDPEYGIRKVKIESFGQGDTTEKIQFSKGNPNILTGFFDGFIDFETLRDDDFKVCQELLENQTAIEKLALAITSIPELERLKKYADDQISALKASNAEKVVALEEGLAVETALKSELIKQLKLQISGLKEKMDDQTLFDFIKHFKEDKIIIGKKEFAGVKVLVETYSEYIAACGEDLKNHHSDLIGNIKNELTKWKQKEIDTQNEIERIRKEIESKGAKLDMAFIKKITKDASDYTLQLSDLADKKRQLGDYIKARREIVAKRAKIKDAAHRKRYEFAHGINLNLKEVVQEFNIDVKINRARYSPSLTTIIKDAMGWRTTNVVKAEMITRRIGVEGCLQILKDRKTDDLASIQYDNKSVVFTRSEAEQIINTLSLQNTLNKIERCEYEDVVTITLTKAIKDDVTGNTSLIVKDFSQLSLGQKQSIMLSVLLFSKGNCPLLIDQPEDNLDSEFIFSTIVKNLRKIKEHRQVIIVTHNANIAVLGDAELIIPLKSTSEKSHILDRGGIDNTSTKKATCAILEGGEKAFKKRKSIYGF